MTVLHLIGTKALKHFLNLLILGQDNNNAGKGPEPSILLGLGKLRHSPRCLCLARKRQSLSFKCSHSPESVLISVFLLSSQVGFYKGKVGAGGRDLPKSAKPSFRKELVVLSGPSELLSLTFQAQGR